ncbi:MAG: zinc ABC transporter solute-binding protein [Bacteroidales bacterium]|nr:zinc ABC transporter solute-binding protein [Bacteroidales bacterium]
MIKGIRLSFLPGLIFLYLFVTLLSGGLASCQAGNQTADSDDSPTLTVTYEPQRWIVERIAGSEDFRINVLLPPGSDAETFTPTVRQLKNLNQGGIWLHLNTIGFERKLLASAVSGSVNPVDVSYGINTLTHTHCGHNHSHENDIDPDDGETENYQHSHHDNEIDPHLWSSVRNTEIIARNILRELVRLNPDKANLYNENFNRLAAELLSLDIEIEKNLTQSEAGAFMVNHPSLSYFARDYGLTQIAVEAEGKQPSILEFRDRIIEAKRAGARAIIVDAGSDADKGTAIADNAGLKVITLNLNTAGWLEEIKKLTEL